MIVARFVGTVSFLIRYSNGHTKLTYRQLKKFAIIFNKTLFLNLKKNKLQSSYYRNVSTDPLGSAEHTLGTTALDGTLKSSH